MKRFSLAGIVVGSVLWTFAPLSGLLVTVALLVRAFAQVDAVDPASKARVLAEGISEAMNCTAAGIALGLVGMVVALACVPLLVRAERRSE